MQNVREALARAAALVDRGQLAAAEEIATHIVNHVPNCVGALMLLGIVARKTGRAAAAVGWLQRACSYQGDDASIRCELGRALADCRRLQEAVSEFRRAAELNPNDAGACLNLGAVLGQLDEFEAALPWCRRAVELAPTDAVARFNLGNIARSLGMLDEATAALAEAVRLAPDFAEAHWNAAYCYLLAGDFARGWREHEWRVAAGEVAIDRYPQPRWNGEPLDSRTILVHAEQGIGDEVLFASCLADLIARAGQCVVLCEPRLEPLFRRSFPKAIVHGFARRQDRQGMPVAERIDFQIPIGSLPLFFRPTRESFPRRERFIAANPGPAAAWKGRLEMLGPGLKIGVSWRAGGQPGERQMRTTALDRWAPLFRIPGIQLINLQYGDCVDELAEIERVSGAKVCDWPDADPLLDMDAFAAKIAALDLVVSVDNSTVHLAGALGVPTWALLAHAPGWRWTLGDTRSVWYSSVRLFRQPARGDWTSVFEHITRLLSRITKSSDPAAALRETMDDDQAAIIKPTRSGSNFSSAAVNDSTSAAPTALPPTALPPNGATSAEAGWSFAIGTARSAFDSGDYATAESLCRQVLAHSPRNVQATNLLGAIAAKTGRADLAIRTLSRASALAADDPVVAINMAAALADSGQIDRAIESFRSVIEKHPNSFDARLGLAKALYAGRRLDNAIAALQEALRIKPDQHKSFNLLGAWCLATDRWAEAESALREAIRLRPDYMAAYNNLGLALERQCRLWDAKQCFARAFELDPSNPQAANNLAAVKSKLIAAAPTSGVNAMFDLARPQKFNKPAPPVVPPFRLPTSLPEDIPATD